MKLLPTGLHLYGNKIGKEKKSVLLELNGLEKVKKTEKNNLFGSIQSSSLSGHLPSGPRCSKVG